MSEPSPAIARNRVRDRIVTVAASLLSTQGPDAVTTRSVAEAAHVQPPTIYRIFGDKNGLLDAVAEYGFHDYMERKRHRSTDADPIENLRSGWILHIGFGLENPELFRLMHTRMRADDRRAAAETGASMLQELVRRVALAGRLAVPEHLAIDLIHATGTGLVFTLIEDPVREPDSTLIDLAWNSLCTSILVDSRAQVDDNPRAAAVTLRAAVPTLSVLSGAEQSLLGEWLERIAAA